MFSSAEMISLHIIVCLLLILQVSASDVDVRAGEDAVLQCRAPSAAAVMVVEWTREDLPPDEYLFFYRNGRSYEKYQHASFRGRVGLRNPDGIRNGDVSVVLRNVSAEDMGTYRCRVLMSGTEAKEHLEEVRLRNRTDSGDDEEPTEEGGHVQRVVTEDGDGLNLPVLVGVLVACLAVAAAVGCYVYRWRKSSHRPLRGEVA